MYQPSKETVLNRWADQLGPQPTVAHMLSHLGDIEIFRPFMPGDEPSWAEALAVLMTFNDRFTVDDVVAELARRISIPPMTVRRKRR